LVSAILFGVSMPTAKALHGPIDPAILGCPAALRRLGIAVLRRADCRISNTTDIAPRKRVLPFGHTTV
jgi:hypothetical protein